MANETPPGAGYTKVRESGLGRTWAAEVRKEKARAAAAGHFLDRPDNQASEPATKRKVILPVPNDPPRRAPFDFYGEEKPFPVKP